MARSLLMNVPPNHITTYTYQGKDSCFTMYVDFNTDISIKAKYTKKGNYTSSVSVYTVPLNFFPVFPIVSVLDVCNLVAVPALPVIVVCAGWT